jgi:endonuclease YncB( thermonuclease family)
MPSSSLLLVVLLLGQTVGKVVSITDGDTIIVRPEQGPSVKVRLIHIDAPERGQAFGTRARQALGNLIDGEVVEVVGTAKDCYGRLLGDVHHDGRSVNMELVNLGMAWAFVEYEPPAEYIEAEKAARAARRGLWVDPEPIPPWEWRKSRRSQVR